MQNKRILSGIAAICFIIVCFSPVQANSINNVFISDNQASISEAADSKITIDFGLATQNAVEVKVALSTTTGAGITTTTGPGIEAKDKKPSANDEALWYRKQNPMKKDHQKLLWQYCKSRKLDYIDMLALIYTESNFKEKSSTGKYFGYFQISKGNCANLAAKLKTKNKPLDGTININWGTAMYSWILADKRVKGLEGKKKRDVALSIYQRGTGGYDKYGISTGFLKVYYKKRNIVSSWFQVKK